MLEKEYTELNLSIIVPIYNSEKYLEKCVNSLLGQTLKNYEIILVDDASTDSSLSIMNQYKSRYPEVIRVIESKVNLRQGGARNLGIMAAKGEYIGFVDSDDWVSPRMYEELFNEANKNNLDVVRCNYIITDGKNEKIIKKSIMSEYLKDESKILNLDKKKLLVENGSVWSMIYRRKMILDNNIFFPEKLAYEDNYFIPIVMFYLKKFGTIEGAFYYYFQGNKNATTKSKNSPHQLDRIITSEMLWDWFMENDTNKDYLEEIEYLYTKYNYLNTTSMLLNLYTKIDWEKISELRNKFLNKYPNYYKNIYYIKNYGKVKRLFMRINDKNIYIYAVLYKIIRLFRR